MQVLLQYQSNSYYIIGQKVYYSIGRFYYIIGQLLHYRRFLLNYRARITVSGVYYIIGWYNTHYQLYALVVPGTGTNLLGRDWLSVLQLNWTNVHRAAEHNIMSLEPYKDLFTACLGKPEWVTAKLYVDETVQPRY